MSRVYYTLIEKSPGDRWAPQFGDYDRKVVEQERQDMINSGSFVKGTKYKIIKTDGKQKSISSEVEIQNCLYV